MGRCLRARVIYTDNIENPTDQDDEAMGVLEAQPYRARRLANAAPRFVDQDLNTPGDQSDRTSRKVAEETRGAGPGHREPGQRL